MAHKPNFTRKKKRAVHGAAFWDKEYANPEYLKLSMNESEDLAKFTRWLMRRKREDILSEQSSVVDIGCGNGRNLIFLARTFGMHGVGVDISSAAIAQARRASHELNISYTQGTAADALIAPDESQALALDMMTSHFLNAAGRTKLRDEIFRVLKPGGYLYMKTFLKDGDMHTERLLKEHPGKEVGTYIHPVIGVPEFVYSEDELITFLSEKFLVRRIYRSHKHVSKGKANKRRTISVYLEKDY